MTGDYRFEGMLASPRCGAKTRHSTACSAPAVKGKRRCRMHGGAPGSGAPKGNRNAVKHGFFTKEARTRRKEEDKKWRELCALLYLGKP